ncbi:predicted protein [Uncinocarpus reesii 1704]|uniref:Peptidase S8/S53 domain-containing protein n=1 Tax=Uncinocarpus reesii (strain UAMH 1704) TaxID=336963 RepID=C4JU77_UNCRE|nr:uncharacterized protein UREG_06016 [Uncinocarpus reesii 1704]EEP81174.1 predicted protein [Uncinocarpus reesii 1704]
MATVNINGNEYKPGSGHARPHGISLSEPRHILLQTKHATPLKKTEKGKLKDEGVHIQEYFSPGTYVCAYRGNGLESVAGLPFIQSAESYPDEVVVHQALKDSTPGPPTARTVDITLHNDATSSAELKQEIADLAKTKVEDVKGDGGKITVTLQPHALEALTAFAGMDAIRYIHEAHEPRPANEITRDIIHGNARIKSEIYKGTGQVIAVADTGFDIGDQTDTLSAFAGRVKRLYPLGRPDNADDPTGHGTHVCGIIVGNIKSQHYQHIEAPASEAQLVIQSCYKTKNRTLGGLPPDLADLFRVPYVEDGARIHTNSWSTAPMYGQPPYNGAARSVDEFVWKHQDMVICFAAGNDGRDGAKTGRTDPGSISSEPAAKNCITVGASESARPDITWDSSILSTKPKEFTYGEYFPSKFPKPPISTDHMANNVDGMAAFSSRGPTKEKRFKPDVVAPGTCILSTCSRRLKIPFKHYGISKDKELMFDSGTSMATPLVASCCAVIREALIKNGCPAPTAALVKALLINGAVELKGQYEPSEAKPTPNSDFGFGRVNLENSLIPVGRGTTGGYIEATLDDDEEKDPYKLEITVPQSNDGHSKSTTLPTLKVTLVYSDLQGAELQNNLNLAVISGDVERHGNQGTKEFRTEGPWEQDDFDNLNNVEQVTWEGISPGKVIIKIRTAWVTSDDQPFACVWQVL